MYVPSEYFLSAKRFFCIKKEPSAIDLLFARADTPAPASANYFLFSWERLAQRIFSLRVYYITLYENNIHPFVPKQKIIFVLLAKNHRLFSWLKSKTQARISVVSQVKTRALQNRFRLRFQTCRPRFRPSRSCSLFRYRKLCLCQTFRYRSA